MCVLEWCKLFGDDRGKHFWGNIVSHPAAFKAALLSHLGIDDAAFKDEIETMRRYRDKFLAHLDSDTTMNIPALDIAKKAVWFYHAHIVAHEAKRDALSGLPLELDSGYTDSEAEAESAFRCQE